MRLPLGHAEIFDGLGQVKVVETLTCPHCNKIYLKPGPGEPSGFCHMCHAPTCLRCGASDRCVPFERRLDQVEARARLLAQVAS